MIDGHFPPSSRRLGVPTRGCGRATCGADERGSFSGGSFRESENALTDNIVFEKNILQKVFGNINVFSFHNTTPFTMNCKAWEYGGLINTYADYFQKNVEYCSDSNGYWRYNRLMDVLAQSTSQRLQILTHPEWWQEEVMSPWQRIQRCIDGRARRNRDFYQNHLRTFGMKNIDWNGIVE